MVCVGSLGPSSVVQLPLDDFHGDGEWHTVKMYVCELNDSRCFYAGTTDWRQVVPMEKESEVLEVYNHALTQSWYIAVTLACVSLVSLLGLEWKKLGRKDTEGHTGDEQRRDRLEDAEIEAKV